MTTKSRGRTTHRATRRSTTKTRKSSTTSRSRSTSASRTRSLQARKQRRHTDGTFAKGFKQHATPKKSPKSTAKRATTRPVASKARKTTHKGSGSRSHSSSKRGRSVSGYTPQMRSAENAFNFDCTEATKKKVLKTVTENFSKSEIEMMDRFGKPLVVNEDTQGKNGAYVRNTTKDKKESPTIILKPNPSEVTVTHELVHQMRTVDDNRDKYAKTAYPIDGKGAVKYDKIKDTGLRKKVKNAEETATAAETELRVKNKSEHVSGYWKMDDHDVSGKATRDSDRRTMRSNGAIKEGTNVTGKTAVDHVNSNYPKTIISSKKEGGETALSTFRKIFSWRNKKKW